MNAEIIIKTSYCISTFGLNEKLGRINLSRQKYLFFSICALFVMNYPKKVNGI